MYSIWHVVIYMVGALNKLASKYDNKLTYMCHMYMSYMPYEYMTQLDLADLVVILL